MQAPTPSQSSEQATGRTTAMARQGARATESDTPARPRPPRQRRTLFSVPFNSRMTDADIARLHASLDMATYIRPKPGVSGASLGVARLDSWSGLFLERGKLEDEWVLEGRTWGNSPEEVVHEWNVATAVAARELDSSVQIPRRPPAPVAQTAIVPLGRAANKRLARLGRRLLGLE